MSAPAADRYVRENISALYALHWADGERTDHGVDYRTIAALARRGLVRQRTGIAFVGTRCWMLTDAGRRLLSEDEARKAEAGSEGD